MHAHRRPVTEIANVVNVVGAEAHAGTRAPRPVEQRSVDRQTRLVDRFGQLTAEDVAMPNPEFVYLAHRKEDISWLNRCISSGQSLPALNSASKASWPSGAGTT